MSSENQLLSLHTGDILIMGFVPSNNHGFISHFYMKRKDDYWHFPCVIPSLSKKDRIEEMVIAFREFLENGYDS